MKLVKKFSAIIVSICFLLPLFCTSAQAASGSLSISGGSGNVGSTVTVSCSIKCSSGPIGAATVVVGYDSSALQYVSATGGANGGSGSVIYAGDGDGSTSSLSFSITFKILKEGSHKVSASCSDAVDWDAQTMSVSGSSATVKGTVPSSNTDNNSNSNNNNTNTDNTTDENDDRDSNNSLSSLQVSPGALSPAFSAGTTSYTVTVPSDTTEVTISAKAASDKAKVSVSGGKDLKLGENSAKVVVTAENGSSKAYNITIVCGEVEKITVNGAECTINEGFADDAIPTGFSRGTITYNEREYAAVVNGTGTLQLVNLQSEAGSTFYIYDAETQEFSPFTQIVIDEGKYIMPLPIDEADSTFGAYEQINLNINDKSFFAWKLDDEFSVLLVMNQDGETLYYKYDSVDGTYQRYAEVPAADGVVIEGIVEEDDRNFLEKYSMYIMAGTACVAVVFIILTIVFGVKLKKKNVKE